MFKKMQRIVASVQQPVLAAVDGKSKKYILANYRCQNPNCRTTFVTNHTASPLCITCSTPMQKVSPETVTLPAHSIVSELPLVGRCQCNSHFHATAELANALDGQKGYCVVCSEEITFDKATSLDDEDIPVDTTDTSDTTGDDFDFSEEPVDTTDVDVGEEDPEFTEDDSTDTSSMTDESEDGGGALDFEDDEEIDAEVPPTQESVPAPTPGTDPDSPPPSVPQDNPGEAAADEAMKGVRDPNAPPPSEATASARRRKIKANSLTAFLKNQANVKEIELTMSSGETPKWWLFADSRPVAFATEAKANDRVKSIFASSQYAQAFRVAAEDGLTPQVVEDFGFEPVQTEMPVDQVTQQAVDTAVADATSDLNSKVNNVAANFESCLGIAAVGSLKGLLPVDNPLQQAVAAELARLGDPNSSVTAQILFKNAGESYLRNIVASAKDLMKKESPALNELAQVVASAEYRETVVAKTPKSTVRQPPIMVPAELQDQSEKSYTEVEADFKSMTGDDMRSVVRGAVGRRYNFAL